jgi:hypothetical protein
MPKATLSQFIAATRTINVPLTFEVDGERKTEDFKVIYKAYSPKVAREMSVLEDEKKDDLAGVLAEIVVSIPEVEGEDGPLAITAENLDLMAQDNLLAIYKAITVDIRPTKAPAPPSGSPVTSETEPAPQS